MPRFSLNPLAEYLTSSPGRRRVIVAGQKHPKAFQVAYYTIAERAIAASWTSGLDEGPLNRVVDELARKPTAKRWDAARQESTIEAIQAFRDMVRHDAVPHLQGLRSVTTQHRAFTIAGVSISIRPELLSSSDSASGGVKLYLSKSTPLSSDRAAYAGALLHLYFESAGSQSANTDPQECFVLDVFAKTLRAAPSAFRRRRRDIEAACSEIAGIWDDV